jgi:hypothetical protein
MPLQKQVVDFTMQIGLDTKTDPKQINPDAAAVLENVRFDQIKAIKPRNGYNILSNTVTNGSYPTNQRKVVSRSGEIVLDGKDGVYSFKPSIGTVTNSWFNTGAVSTEYLSNTTRKLAFDFAYTWHTNGTVNAYFNRGYVHIEDAATNGTIFKYAPLTEVIYGGIGVFSDVVIFAWLEVGTFELKAISINLTTLAVTASGSLGATFDPSLLMKFVTRGDTHWAVGNDNTVVTFAKGSFTPTGTFTTTHNIEELEAVSGATASDDRLVVAYFNGSNIPQFVVYDWAGNTTVAATNLSGTTFPTLNRQRNIFIGQVSTSVFYATCIAVELTGYTGVREFSVSSFNSVTGASASAPANCNLDTKYMYPVSKPFIYDGIGYQFNIDPNVGTLFLVSGQSGSPSVCKIGEIRNFTVNDTRVTQHGSSFSFPYLSGITSKVVGPTFSIAVQNYDNLYSTTVTFTKSTYNFGKSIEYSNTAYLPKSGLMQWDGSLLTNVGFYSQPTLGVVTNATSGGLIPAGTYQYVAVFKYKDSNGKTHRSVVSNPLSVTTTGASSLVTIAISSPAFDSTKNTVIIDVYRTTAAGIIFYLVGSLPVNSTVNSVNFIDGSSNAISVNPIVYINGGVLDSNSVSSIKAACIHQNRFFGVSSEDGSLIYYTKEIESDFSPEWNEDLFLRVDDGLGSAIGLASLDEKLVVFKRNEIFVFVGEGPSPSGVNSSYSAPNLLTSDVGLIEELALVNIPDGVIFKAARGWQLLTRNLQVEYIGAPVERFGSLTVSQVVLDNVKNLVYCLHTDGTVLVFDYVLNRWAVWNSLTAIAADFSNGQLVYLNSNGRVHQFSDSKWLDGSTALNPKITTAWIALTGIQGYQRVYDAILFGEFRGAHQLRVKVSFDYDPLWKEEFTISSDSARIGTALTDSSYYSSNNSLGGKPGLTLQYRIKQYIQTCESIRFEITVLNSSNVDTETVRLSGLSLTVGVKGKTNRMNVERVIT